jgi:hypothetical protein
MFKFLRKDLLLILAVAAVFLAVSYAVGSGSEAPMTRVESEVAFLDGDAAPRRQAAPARVWKEFAFEKTLGLDPPTVQDPSVMRVGGGGEIYLLDWDDFRVRVFSLEGKLLKTFGQGKGTGVGAFVKPTSISVRPDGELWVCDPKLESVKRYTPDGKVRDFYPQGAAHRVEAVGDVMVTMGPAVDDTLFEVYDLSGNLLGTFGKLIKDQSSKGISLDGNVVGDDETRGFIYASYKVPVIAGYDVDGRQRFVVQPIEASPLPMAVRVGETQKANRNATTVTWSMSIDGDKLYALTGAKVPGVADRGGLVVDVYDKRDGNYQFSFKLPLACKQVVVHGDYLYGLPRGGSLRVWRFRQST